MNERFISIYLAGGFRSGWQERVKSANTTFHYLDPNEHGIEDTEEYTFWDIFAIDACDWVLAYMEKTNPAGYALSLEIGYAKARGKKVILVDEKSPTDEKFYRYWAMCHACADIRFNKLEGVINYLSKFEDFSYD